MRRVSRSMVSGVRRSDRLAAAWVLLGIPLLSGCAVIGSDAVWQEAFPEFRTHVVDADFQSGYQAITFDVDGDGLPDIVALSTAASRITWYRNPGWEPYEILTGETRFISMAPHDIDGDGRMDLAVAAEFSLGDSQSGGVVFWARAPEAPRTTLEWPSYRIDAVPTSHRLRWADVTGDGRRELVNLPIIGVGATAPEYLGAAHLLAYRIPADPTGPWEKLVLDDTRLEVAHGLEVVDWDGDGRDDLLTASQTGLSLYRPSRSGSPEFVIPVGQGNDGARPDRGSSEVGLGRLGDERFLAAVEPWHGNEVVVYRGRDGDPLPWPREVIDTGLTGGHALVAVDLNGDGFDEIVAGGRGGDRSLLIFRFRPEEDRWERIPLDLGGVAVSSLAVEDLNGDGWMDLVAIGAGSNNVVWYENLGL